MYVFYKSRFLICFICLLSFSGCEINSTENSIPLGADLMGRWKWVRTETPSKTLSPATEGYEEDLSIGNNTNDYTVIYRADTLFFSSIEDRNKNVQEDKKANTVLIPYSSGGYIKFFLKYNEKNVLREIERSEIMKEYSESADTVRYVYVRAGFPARDYER
jgi:hypothetical protein